MIKYDYVITRNEYDIVKTYLPELPKELNDLIFIEGPNSSGKSTLLHILALSIFGLKNKKIHDSLIDKMKSLYKSEHQNLKFNVSIKNSKNGLEIVAEKENADKDDIVVYEIINNKKNYLSYETFNMKYNLIYDIPNNPIGRLTELTSDLKIKQSSLGNRIYQLNSVIRKIIDQVKDSKDPEKIKELENEINDLEYNCEVAKKECELIKEEKNILTKYTYIRSYLDYKERVKIVDQKVKDKKKAKKIEQVNDTKNNSFNEQFYTKGLELINFLRADINDFSAAIRHLVSKKDLFFILIWEKTNFKEIFYENDENDILIKGINYYKKLFLKEQNKSEDNEKIKELKLYAKLINLLKEYVDSNIILPGLEKSISEFIKLLYSEYKKFEPIKNKTDNIEKASEILKDIESRRIYFLENFAQKMKEIENIKKRNGKKEDDIDYEEIEYLENCRELEDLKENLKDLEKNLIKINIEVENKDLERRLESLELNKIIKIYINYTDSQLKDKISRIAKDLKTKEAEVIEVEHSLGSLKNEKKLLESKEPHQYQGKIKFLNNLSARTLKLTQIILNDYEKYLQALINKEKPEGENISNQLEYNELLSIYMGKKVKTIKHTSDEDLVIKKIDLLNKKIETESGKVIFLDDLGTGQSQAAFLRGILNSKDERKIIALIDEVEMMDSTSLSTVTRIMKEQYAKGDLLVGIVVRKAEELKTFQF